MFDFTRDGALYLCVGVWGEGGGGRDGGEGWVGMGAGSPKAVDLTEEHSVLCSKLVAKLYSSSAYFYSKFERRTKLNHICT